MIIKTTLGSVRKINMIKDILKKWDIALKTMIIVVFIIAIKLLIEYFSLDFITLNALYTSIIAGVAFLFGIMIAGTLADYKEAEKVPAEITAALESIYEEGLIMSRSDGLSLVLTLMSLTKNPKPLNYILYYLKRDGYGN